MYQIAWLLNTMWTLLSRVVFGLEHSLKVGLGPSRHVIGGKVGILLLHISRKSFPRLSRKTLKKRSTSSGHDLQCTAISVSHVNPRILLVNLCIIKLTYRYTRKLSYLLTCRKLKS